MPDRRLKAWQRWLDAAGPWRGWAVCPALTMPGVADRAARIASDRDGLPVDQVLTALGEQPTALVVDLSPTVGVRLAAEVSARGLADVVLVLPRWPHADAVLSTTSLVAALLRDAARVTVAEGARHVVFVLDAERGQPIHRAPKDGRIDNRYELSGNELPSLAELRAAGIDRVVKLTRGRAS